MKKDQSPTPNEEARSQGKKAAVVAYITLIGALIAWSMNHEYKDPFGRFHVRQGLGLNLTFWLMAILLAPVENVWIVTPLFFGIALLWMYGFIKALQNEMVAVPLVGAFYQKLFKNFA